MRDRLENWILLRGDRNVVAGCLIAVVAGILLPAFAGLTIRNATPAYYICSGLITANVTLITVVVAINQVVLSRELEAPGELVDEIEQTADYRRTSLDRSPAPAQASAFHRRLARQTHDRARSLADASTESTGREVRAEIEHLVPDLLTHCERVDERLDDSGSRLYSTIDPVIGTPYAEYVHRTKQIRSRVADGGDEELFAIADGLADDLEHLDVARQYFSTMVVKEELANVSRSLVAVGVPGVAVPIALLVQLTAIRGTTVPSTNLLVLMAFTVLVGLAPLALLSSYVLRIATMARHIASITPFEAA